MNEVDTAEIAGMVRMLWPHSVMDPRTPEVWHPFLETFEKADVEAAVRELAASGRQHALLVGDIVQAVSERIVDSPDWDEAWAEIDRMVVRYGRDRVPKPEKFSHPAVAAFAIPAWKELCNAPAPGTKDYGIHQSQQREAYKALRHRANRNLGLAAIGAPRRRSGMQSLGEAIDALKLGSGALKQLPSGRREDRS